MYVLKTNRWQWSSVPTLHMGIDFVDLFDCVDWSGSMPSAIYGTFWYVSNVHSNELKSHPSCHLEGFQCKRFLRNPLRLGLSFSNPVTLMDKVVLMDIRTTTQVPWSMSSTPRNRSGCSRLVCISHFMFFPYGRTDLCAVWEVEKLRSSIERKQIENMNESVEWPH